MRFLSFIALFLFIVQSSCANTEQASKESPRIGIDSAFISLLQNDLPKPKYTDCTYEKGQADVDVMPYYKFVIDSISKDFLIRILDYSSRFCWDSTGRTDLLKNKILLLNENIFLIKFHYREENDKVTDIISVIYCKDMYIILSSGFKN